MELATGWNEVNDRAIVTTRVAKEAEPRRRDVARDLELHETRASAGQSLSQEKEKPTTNRD
jgi:hypothetical protein